MQSSANENNVVSFKSAQITCSEQGFIIKKDSKLKYKYPVARWKHASVIFEDFLYIMGGYSWTNTLKDLWRLNLRHLNKLISQKLYLNGTWNSLEGLDYDHEKMLWEDLSNFTGNISPLQSHTMVAYKNQLYIFGGAFTYDTKNCPFWIYDIEFEIMRKWKSENSNVLLPIPRRNHSCSIYRNTLVIFGGFGDIRGSLQDLWAFDFDTEIWHLLWAPSNGGSLSKRDSWKLEPRGRHDHKAVVHKNDLFIFGGMSGLEICNDLWKWNFDDRQWTKLVYKGDLSDFSYIIETKVYNYWLMFGINSVKKKNENWIYSFSQNRWTASTTNIPKFYSYSTLLMYSESQNHFMNHLRKHFDRKPKDNKIYPESLESSDNVENINLDYLTNQNCCINNPAAISIKPRNNNYQTFNSFETLSKDTVFTNLSDSLHCETSFINDSDGEEVSVDLYNREFLIILGNNIDGASFDYHLNIQLLFL